jgi:hypothetical protein
MIKRNIFVFVLFLGILILTTNALALDVGAPFWFYDCELPGETTSWSHDFYDVDKNDFFYPSLDGSEPNLIIDRAWLLLSLNFTPSDHVFKAYIMLDGVSLGIIDYHFSNNLDKNRLWSTRITNPIILFDREPNIEINELTGTLKYVHNSILAGSGHVGPEPISMALVGAGLVGLPIAVRFRRLLRK